MNRRKFLHQSSISSIGIMLMPSLSKFNLKSPFENYSTDKIFNVTNKGIEMDHFWSFCVGAGRANEGLRASWLEQMTTTKKACGFKYCRFHGLFHDDMFVYREINGKVSYNWQYIDDLFDRMLQIGVRPFVELSFMPNDLASSTSTVFWWKGHNTPPNNYEKWGELIKAFTQHCVDRYGLNEVHKWFFEVWNEPDLHIFWNGTKSQYLELYKVSVNAIKSVDPGLKVGGPATSNFVPDERFDGEVENISKQKTFTVENINKLQWKGVWIEDFLDYCKKENLPVDFVSTHPYPTDYAIDPETKKGGGKTREVDATLHDLQWLNKTVKHSSFPNAKIHLTEWSSSPSPRDPNHDMLPAAAYIIKVNLDCVGLADSLSYWTFTDVFEEGGAGNSIYHGGFGLINYQGIVKPTFHAYRMLNRLGEEYIHKEDGLVITRHKASGKITALLYHYPAEFKEAVGGDVDKTEQTGSSKSCSIVLNHLKYTAKFIVEVLDEDNGYGHGAWAKMGKPVSPTQEQTSQLRKEALTTKNYPLYADNKGDLNFKCEMQPWSCILIDQL